MYEPWEVASVIFDRALGEVVITVDLARRLRFDVTGKEYRHLYFLRYRCY